MTLKKDNDIDFEIQFYEGVLKDNPNFVDGLVALGDAYTKKGLYQKGLLVDLKLARLKPDDPAVFYNLACSYSLLEELDKAFVAIKKAVKYGYSNLHYMKLDQDLENLRKDQRFKRYFLKLKEKLKS